MADLGTLITIAEKVFHLLQSPILKDMKDWKSNLENLNKSVSFIKNMLLDIDMKPKLSHGEQALVEELTEVLYEADDLFDEVITIAKLKELYGGGNVSEKVLDKVSRFFSSKNRILVSYNTSQEVKTIQQKLDAIAKDHARYDFKVDPQAHTHDFKFDPQANLDRREKACAFLNAVDENIIGREGDVKVVVDMLLDPNVEENIGFVVVVGVGGLGKTTLARLVYNHDRVESKFEKNLWVCVSDQNEKRLNVQDILSKIIESSTNKKPSDISTMQSMQTKLQQELKNKVYLLILDDVWTENPHEWSELRKYLTIGGRGSRVVITTRSENTAEMILGKSTPSKIYMLRGLSDDDSWCLFKMMAFESESDQANDPELTKIGKIIVGKCFNVPLAIKVLGALLYGQTHRWESFEKKRLSEIETRKNPILSVLKLSYNYLEPSLKNCFRYCALFPKDFEMKKNELISLWMAQGYIGDSEDNFLILLKRCFFQDVKKDKFGEVISFKMHDLMHDLAQEVAGDEIIVVNSPPNNLGKKIRHLFLNELEWAKSTSLKRHFIRTCYMSNYTYIHSNMVEILIANWRHLRSLRLLAHGIKNLPESIGELLHLRYLDLSQNINLETLPNSIGKLYNLQSLNMRHCYNFKKWPTYFCKLVNLRRLDICGCSRLLTGMPLGIGQLTNLRDLSNFIVDGKQFGGQLNALKFLVNLRGKIDIMICSDLVSDEDNVLESGILEHIKNLKVLKISFPLSNTNVEALAAQLQPNQNLMQLRLADYCGTEIPRWGRAHDDWAIILPNLVKIKLDCCLGLQGIPLLSNLKHLKFLFLRGLELKYIETNSITCDSSRSKDLPFFPSLENLRIHTLRKMKGWWGGVGEGSTSTGISHRQPAFPRLSSLYIRRCTSLTSFPPCPALKFLEINTSNKSLRILTGEGPTNLDLDLRVEEIDNVGYLTTLPACCLTHIKIKDDQELQRLSEIEEVFKSSSSLRSLQINNCERLTSLSGALEHLTALESLSLIKIPAELDDDDIPWRSLRHNLHSLELESLVNLQILPRGMKHLTALQNLSIESCDSLKSLPEWISCLSSLRSLRLRSCDSIDSLGTIKYITSLQKLDIFCCRQLTGACQELSGREWPNIQHIPQISVTGFHW